MPQDVTDDKSTMIQVMASCYQAANHYPIQCWLISISPYEVIRSQWLKLDYLRDTGVAMRRGKWHTCMKLDGLFQLRQGNKANKRKQNSMMMSSNGNIFRVTGHLCGEFTGPRWIPHTRPVTQSFDVFFDLRLNKRLSKQWRGWWFETLSRLLWRHRNAHSRIHCPHKGPVMLKTFHVMIRCQILAEQYTQWSQFHLQIQN